MERMNVFCVPVVLHSCPSYWWNGDEYLGPAASTSSIYGGLQTQEMKQQMNV